MILLVATPAVLQTFIERQPQRFVQRVVHRDGRGVMISAVLTPIRREQIHVEIPTLNFGFAIGGGFEGARTVRRRREYRWTTQKCLSAAVKRVHLHFVYTH